MLKGVKFQNKDMIAKIWMGERMKRRHEGYAKER
jgi:hypothetical protein